ncbi:hypothetical protein K8352_01335 [Flavobacteriaceae bacterium F89]|uniref:Uncharacterized protein n=1 Tax=Cerina litoralis TaxID=2874477 RepID=A0AAE3ES68_9FLAO|nr:hypothetical protein [Cerina litoralis]MCG2459385.1 hypothetical protein [Cerina litoralis]
MNEQKKTRILIIDGILIISLSQIVPQFLEISDMAKGLMMGVGIGILVVAIVFNSYRPANR